MLRHHSQKAVQKAAIATHSLSNSPFCRFDPQHLPPVRGPKTSWEVDMAGREKVTNHTHASPCIGSSAQFSLGDRL